MKELVINLPLVALALFMLLLAAARLGLYIPCRIVPPHARHTFRGRALLFSYLMSCATSIGLFAMLLTAISPN